MFGQNRDIVHAPVVRKRLSFPSVALLCITAVLVTAMVGGFGIVAYGMRIIDGKTDSLTGLVTETVRSLPELRENLPPVLADAINDARRPDYVSQLEMKAHVLEHNPRGYARAVVEVKNAGDEMVSLLSLRVVGLNEQGDAIMEEGVFAASPIQIEDDWRGPLMPGATRRIPVFFWEREAISTVQPEITDVRVWTPNSGEPVKPIMAQAGAAD